MFWFQKWDIEVTAHLAKWNKGFSQNDERCKLKTLPRTPLKIDIIKCFERNFNNIGTAKINSGKRSKINWQNSLSFVVI